MGKIHKEALPTFVFIEKGDEFYSIESGKDPRNSIVFFDDQYKVIKNILNGNKK